MGVQACKVQARWTLPASRGSAKFSSPTLRDALTTPTTFGPGYPFLSEDEKRGMGALYAATASNYGPPAGR